ncbi:MAG TPA: tyrosinase family protein, partial [Vicinamibacterales bacterium]|nr:tyrosinase family protein [Vicinamibacterales bacterium]
MNTEVILNGSTAPDARYIGWAPLRCDVRLTDATGATTPVTVTLQNQNPAAGGQLLFFAPGPGAVWQDQIALTLPLDGSPVGFFVAGRFGRPSVADKDAAIDVREAGTNAVLSTTTMMVRVRKDANTLTPGERANVVSAFATLNGAGTGRFTRFRDMHRDISRQEAHGLPGFLSWHRAYLLDLERELQSINPGVALPYWRFDLPAPQLFAPDFFGVSDQNGVVHFDGSNPIQFWKTDGQPGILRSPSF